MASRSAAIAWAARSVPHGITMAGFYGMVFLQSLYFQQRRGHSALATGLLFLPMTALVAVLSYLAPRIASRFGRLVPFVAG